MLAGKTLCKRVE